ncbi:MAG TPA: VOC family protein [Myxococcaceae bacterium]|nr:VOC family protein [Myxococcaceae bacterium]
MTETANPPASSTETPAAAPVTTAATPFLMFHEGKAEEAINFYVSLFKGGELLELKKYGPNEVAPEGTVMRARFRVAGLTVMAMDSSVPHDFNFTPAFSLFLEVESEEELRRLAEKLSEGGRVFMPMAAYGFSRQFTWCSDKYGVSWQINWT